MTAGLALIVLSVLGKLKVSEVAGLAPSLGAALVIRCGTARYVGRIPRNKLVFGAFIEHVVADYQGRGVRAAPEAFSVSKKNPITWSANARLAGMQGPFTVIDIMSKVCPSPNLCHVLTPDHNIIFFDGVLHAGRHPLHRAPSARVRRVRVLTLSSRPNWAHRRTNPSMAVKS
jgi:hypothetical protein